jgi:hypothetical protein
MTIERWTDETLDRFAATITGCDRVNGKWVGRSYK